MKTYWWTGVQLHAFTSAINGGEWSASRHGRFIPRERAPFYPLIRRLVGPQSRSGGGGEEKTFPTPTGTLTTGHLARSPALDPF
jgi:hypothetical protein